MKSAYPHISLTDEEVRAIFDHIDINDDGSIDKEEMGQFLHMLIHE